MKSDCQVSDIQEPFQNETLRRGLHQPDSTLRPEPRPEDADRALRPQELDAFIGQREARANLRVAQQLGTSQQAEGIEAYDLVVKKAITDIEAEDVPQGLEDFHAAILGAMKLRREYFEKAGEIYDEKVKPLVEESLSEAAIERERSNAQRDAAEILEAKAASAKLTSAWNRLHLRYDGHWDKTVRESVFLHLRAMDP